MIPYFIQEANSSEDVRDNNIYITYNSSDRCNMNEMIIRYIINVMYEFCSEEYGHDIKITSYDDFCDKYWEMKEIRIRGWYNIFCVYYFEKNWMEWNIEDYKQEIYNAYVKNYNSSVCNIKRR
jgi:hypothetical protein